MKRFISCMLILLMFSCTAYAESIREQLGAPETYEATDYSNTGRTKVVVKAMVYVPKVSAISTYELMPRTISEGETEALANLYFGEQQWWHGDTGKAEVFYTAEEGNGYTFCGCDLYSLEGVSNYLGTSYSTMQFMGEEYYCTNYIEICNEQGGFSRSVGTPEEARKAADALVHAVWPDMVFDSIDPALDNLNGRLQGQYGYRVYYRRDVDGIPVTPVSGQIRAYALENNSAPPLCYEICYVDVDADGIFWMRYEHPVSIGTQIMPNVALLPFDQMMSVFGLIAPLTIASTEGGNNNTLEIDRITLGYMGVQTKDDLTRYQLIPVWDFFGIYSVSGEINSRSMEPLVTINAMDGTVIDRKYGY